MKIHVNTSSLSTPNAKFLLPYFLHATILGSDVIHLFHFQICKKYSYMEKLFYNKIKLLALTTVLKVDMKKMHNVFCQISTITLNSFSGTILTCSQNKD